MASCRFEFLALPFVTAGARFTGDFVNDRFVLSVSESVSVKTDDLPIKCLDFRAVTADRVSLRAVTALAFFFVVFWALVSPSVSEIRKIVFILAQ